MKKLMLIAAVSCFIFASCGNKAAQEPAPAEPTQECQKPAEQKQECQMTEEQKQFKADWENWANLTDERKAELIAKKKECFDNHRAQKMEEMKEMQTKMAEMDAKVAKWNKMTLDEQKQFFDDMHQCCKNGGKEGCGNHEGGCQKQECCKNGGKEGCGNHEGGCQNKK